MTEQKNTRNKIVKTETKQKVNIEEEENTKKGKQSKIKKTSKRDKRRE